MTGGTAAVLLLGVALAAQGPGPWMADPTENAVRRLHSGALDGRTAIWLRIVPKPDRSTPGATTLLFHASFAGRTPRTPPPVTLLVSSDVRIAPLTLRVPRLRLTLDDQSFDLLAPGEPTTLTYCCGDQPLPTGATIALSGERLDRLATATVISGDALGVPFALDDAQRLALAEFRRALVPSRR